MELLSRSGESLFWASRYLERVEDTARIVLEHMDLHVDLPLGREVGWGTLLRVAAVGDRRPALPGSEVLVLDWLIHDRDNPGSIASGVDAARENLRFTWYLTPPEIWESINRLTELCDRRVLTRPARHLLLRDIIANAMQINAVIAGSMSRNFAASFWQLGRDIERADMTTRALSVRVGSMPDSGIALTRYEATRRGTGRTRGVADSPTALLEASETPFDNVLWMSALRSVGAHQMFRRSTGSKVSATSVARFLLQDPDFPRSVAHCLERVATHVKSLPWAGDSMHEAIAAQHLVAEISLPSGPEELDDMLDDVQDAIGSIATSVQEMLWTPALELA